MNLITTIIFAAAIGIACSSPMSVYVRSARNRRQSETETSGNEYDIVPVIEVEPSNNAELNDVLVIDEYLVKVRDDESIDDMELAASSHIFRPLFRYRAQIEKRHRLNRGVSIDQVPGQQQRIRRYY